MSVGTAKPAKMKIVRLHPDVHKALKLQAVREDINMEDVAHRILCVELERPDLLGQTPRDGHAANITS